MGTRPQLGILDEGAKVMIVDIDQHAGVDAHDELAARGEVAFEPVDLADEVARVAVVMATRSWAGALDVFVNNAAMVPRRRVPLAEFDRAR